MKRLLASLIAGTMLSAAAWAQGPGAAPAPAPAQAIFVSSRSPLIDAAIFAVLAGGAVFAVVRSSNRV